MRNALQLPPFRATLERDLKKILRSDQISLRNSDRLSYGRDANSKAILWAKHQEIRYPPEVVVWPESTQEVGRVARWAHEEEIPLVPFGGGSGVCGGTWFLKGGISLDLKRMDKILKLDGSRMRLTAQTGINGEILERHLQSRGLTLGHFPSSIYAATLGGYLACRSAGQFSSYYGKIEDMVEGLEVVTAGGEVIQIDSVKEKPECFDLKELFLGSEGTLGILTQAQLKIHPQPEHQQFLSFSFPNLEGAIDAIRQVLQRELAPTVVRLYDPLDTLLFSSYDEAQAGWGQALRKAVKPALHWAKDLSLRVALKNPPALRKMLALLPSSCLLILSFQGSAALAEARRRSAEQICMERKGKNLGETPGLYWYRHRYSVSYKLSPLFDEGFFADTMEVATSWSNLLNLYAQVRRALSEESLVFAHFSHAYPEGCSIYFTFVGDGRDAAAAEARYDRLWEGALRACVEAGGTITHHHGVGILKAAFMKEEWGEAFQWLCKVKKELDPKNILNPGKLGFS